MMSILAHIVHDCCCSGSPLGRSLMTNLLSLCNEARKVSASMYNCYSSLIWLHWPRLAFVSARFQVLVSSLYHRRLCRVLESRQADILIRFARMATTGLCRLRLASCLRYLCCSASRTGDGTAFYVKYAGV
ncbi:hypothetical protein BV25DRAFT_31014 [Artomyces pyxidatus]|uniref:Uncharacterized protein n=1 Tax=Artomyces pyxidatus TaxID=48021 RepID=A0ACB8TJZ2_9AGAM|nr:hypothetical protein BV25DRAFT_31014 [Artomyces pyxidatus]